MLEKIILNGSKKKVYFIFFVCLESRNTWFKYLLAILGHPVYLAIALNRNLSRRFDETIWIYFFFFENIGSISLTFCSSSSWIRKIIVNIKIYRLSTVNINFNANLSETGFFWILSISRSCIYIYIFFVISTEKIIIIRNVDYFLCLSYGYIVTYHNRICMQSVVY